MTRDLREEAARVRQELDAMRLSPPEVARLRQRIAARLEQRRPPGLVLRLGVGLAAVAAGAVVAVWQWSTPAPMPWYQLEEGGACTLQEKTSIRVDARCAENVVVRLNDSDRIELGQGSELWSEPAGLRLRRGVAAFRIAYRPAQPFRVATSHGVIAVVGTSFRVVQSDDGGRIDVETGRVRYSWADGYPPTELGPGGSLSWPRDEPKTAPLATAPPAARDHSPTTPAKPVTAPPVSPPDDDIATVMRRVAHLGSQRRYDEVVTLLRESSTRSDFTTEQRERFSFELGLLLGRHVGQTESCAHWRTHLERFPAGQRAVEAQTLLSACAP